LQRVGGDLVVLHELVQGLARDAAEARAGHAEALELPVVEAADDGLLADLADLRRLAGREHGLHASSIPYGLGPWTSGAVGEGESALDKPGSSLNRLLPIRPAMPGLARRGPRASVPNVVPTRSRRGASGGRARTILTRVARPLVAEVTAPPAGGD